MSTERRAASELQSRLRGGEFVVTAEITPPVSTDPAEFLRRALPALVFGPRIAPHVKLLQIQARGAKIRKAFLGHLDDVISGEDIGNRRVRAARPFQVLRRHLGRDIQPPVAVALQRGAQQLLAVAGSVRERGIEEGAPELDRAIERPARLAVVRAAPGSAFVFRPNGKPPQRPRRVRSLRGPWDLSEGERRRRSAPPRKGSGPLLGTPPPICPEQWGWDRLRGRRRRSTP